jgi:hypothetical protein
MHCPDRIYKKKKKKKTTLEVKTSSFYWTQQSEGVSPTPSTYWIEEIFGLGCPDWACYFRGKGAPLTTSWCYTVVCHESYVNVNNLGCRSQGIDNPLSISEP